MLGPHWRSRKREWGGSAVRDGAARGVAEITTDALQERKHIAQYVDRANLFLKNIQQRKKTIERITRCLIEIQQGFIETGSRAFLVPLTRTELAERAGLHESTVSRALLRKFVQLPSQDVVAFDSFFTAAGSVKDMIASSDRRAKTAPARCRTRRSATNWRKRGTASPGGRS